MEQLSLSEKLMYSTIRIECVFEGGMGTGTGFFMNLLKKEGMAVPVIVTNKHVVKGAITGKLIFTLSDGEGNPNNKSHYNVEFNNFQNSWIDHPEVDIDLCILPIAEILTNARLIGKYIFYMPLETSIIPVSKQIDELKAIENIVMVGYPNGIWDQINNLPVMRRGITATHPKFDYNGLPQLIIDAACFPGSSGSPVFILDEAGYTDKKGTTYLGGSRIIFLGVLFAGPQHTAQGNIHVVDIPLSQREIVISSIPNNLGFVIKSNKLLDFEKILSGI